MKKKISNWAGIIWFVVCMIFVGFTFRYHIVSFINTIFPPDPIEKINLTEKQKLEYFVFSYIDGSYVYNSYESSVDEWQEPVELIAVDDRNINEYITWQVFIYNLYYDGVNKKPCRTKIVFNNSEGTPVNVTLKTQDGSVITRQLYYSIYAEDSFLRLDTASRSGDDYSIYETDQYSYVAVNNMANPQGENLKKELLDLKNEKVILDLRTNYGGSQEYAAKYIYPALFSEDVEEKNHWYMPDSVCNQTITKDFVNKLILHLKEAQDPPYDMETGNKMMYSEVSQSYKGRAGSNKKVIILTSHKTGSAADRFASDMQKNHLAVVMGNNTGGEGLMKSYNSVCLPNSRLVFIYMPGGALNPDGSDNSVCGTKPDIYITQSIDDFYTYHMLLNDHADVLDFDTRLKYDTVLRSSVMDMK